MKTKYIPVSPDGSPFSPDLEFDTPQDAFKAILKLIRDRYNRHGYYSTADRTRLTLDEAIAASSYISYNPDDEDEKPPHFTNGFTSWQETHAEICFEIGRALAASGLNRLHPRVLRRYELQGRGGIYELARELTDEFEEMNKGKAWDGEFFDEIDSFIQNRLK